MRCSPGNLDEQQAQLVQRLRAAGGGPVSFEELRALGIENPALLCYELAAVGLPITRTSSAGEGMPALSARLEPEPEPAPTAEGALHPPQTAREIPAPRPSRGTLEAAGARALVRLGRARAVAGDVAGEVARRCRGALAGRRLGAPVLTAMIALAVAFAAVLAIALSDLAHDRAARVHPDRARASVRSEPATQTRQPRPQTTPAPDRARSSAPSLSTGTGSPATHTSTSTGAAVQLEAEGHRLLSEGSYASAAAALVGAIKASGQSLGDCMEPADEACLTFAYALYDLGRALRLQGRHAEAITILNERLRIDNQRETVRHELDLARGASA